MAVEVYNDRPLLTIAIPTWNRAKYLALNLGQLMSVGSDFLKCIEILICDNASSDDTGNVIAGSIATHLPIRHIRNPENIGSDCNIAQCFNLANGHYVMILGDDDLLVDGALQIILELLESRRYGVVSVRPYGYEKNFRDEYPGGNGSMHEFTDVGEFVVRLGMLSTLISANIISKDLLPNIDAQEFCGSNLVQTNLIYLAASSAKANMWVDKYLVACKRNNSGGYAFSQVFVDSFGAIIDKFRNKSISEAAVRRLERRLLVGYYPFYIWRDRLDYKDNLVEVRRRFYSRYVDYKEFWVGVAPMLWLPRPFALLWGGVVVTLGRVLDGDFRRGMRFIIDRMLEKINHFLKKYRS